MRAPQAVHTTPGAVHKQRPFPTCVRKCHHSESITSVTLRCASHSCHIDVVLSVGVQPVQDHIPLAVPVTDLVLAGSSSVLVVHLQWGGRQGGEEGVVSSWSP